MRAYSAISTTAAIGLLCTALAGCASSKVEPARTPTRAPASSAAPTAAEPTPSETQAVAESTSGLVFRTSGNPVEVQLVSPDTGEVTATQDFDPTAAGAVLQSGYEITAPFADRSVLSEDLTKYAARQQTTDGITHVGWFDSTTQAFVDASGSVQDSSGFSTPGPAVDPQFQDGKFYFALLDAPNGSLTKAYVVDPADPTAASVVKTFKNTDGLGVGSHVYVAPGGRIVTRETIHLPLGKGWTYGMYDPIDDSHYLTERDNRVGIATTTKTDSEGSSVKPITPVTNRTIGTVVISPDRSRIAFVASQGSTTSVFVQRLDGGEPQQVATGVTGRLLRWQ